MKKLFLAMLYILVITSVCSASTLTTNYSLSKPGAGDTDWAGEVNTNFDTIDSQMKTNADAITSADHTDHGDGANCTAGSYPLGVDADGAVESCTDASTEIDSIVATGLATQDNCAEITNCVSNAQAGDAELTTIAALTETNDAVMFVAGGVWTADTTPAIDCTDCTNVGGAEVNNLETVTTGILTTEIPIGQVAGESVYHALSGEASMTEGGVVTIAGTHSGSAHHTVFTPTDFDTDYAGETVTSDWDLSGANIELPNNTAPVAGDCDAAAEYGRITVDTDATTGQQIYVCESTGWVLQGDGGGAEVNNLETVATDIILNEVPIGTSADTATYKLLPSCSNAATSKLLFNNSTQAFSCGTDQDSGGATAYDSIGDPTGAGLITFADTETATYDTASDGENFMTISLSAADLATDTTNLLLTAVDNDDVNYIPFLIQDDEDGTPDTLFKVGYDGTTTIGAGASGSVDFGTNTLSDTTVGNLKKGYINLPVQSAKLSGAYVTTAHTGVSAAVGAGIDAGNGEWRLLFDATTDEAGVWGFRMPYDYNDNPVMKIVYSMDTATTLEVEWEVSVMAITDGETTTVGFDTTNVGSATVPGTVGLTDEVSISLANADSVAAGDLVYIYISTDSDDGTNDDATGDRELLALTLEYERD